MLKFPAILLGFGRAVANCILPLLIAINVPPVMADQPSNSQSPVVEKDVRKARAILMPDGIGFLYKPKEQELVEIGCMYVTEDPSAINALIGLLSNSDIRPITNAENVEANPFQGVYQGVYLDFSDGTTKKYLFDTAATGERVIGFSEESGSKVVVHFTANPVAKPLREWSSTVGKHTNHGPLDLLRESCDKN